MNPFLISWIVLFVPYCICQNETSKIVLKSNRDSEHMILCDTYMQTHEINYLWTIHQFSQQEVFKTEIVSPMLHALSTDKYEWYVEIWPESINTGVDERAISLMVFISNSSTFRDTVSAMINVSIVNDKKEVQYYKNLETAVRFTAGSSYTYRGWWDFCEKDYFFRNHLLQNDTLRLFIHITWLSEEKSYDVVHHNIVSSIGATPETTTIKPDPTENSESMLENLKFADVVFITNGSNYPAHKNILAARSPVFAAMFRRKYLKNGKLKKIRINVTSINEKVLRAMLRYIYTGKCEELGNLTGRLFEAATKYGLDELRQICQQSFCKT
ncbi:speckle-type POZ protein-like isoform X3 [Planococcus citri]|uniref:speckle-type POZ protein-like isoform X3 n=1 Tax=Planococcus citri TaxID=170843 RepID=UPI0031F893DC